MEKQINKLNKFIKDKNTNKELKESINKKVDIMKNNKTVLK